MKQVYCAGSLGDAFTLGLKIMKEKDVEIFHYTVHKHWYSKIKEIYNIFHNIRKVNFIEYLQPEKEISGIPEKGMVWFPSQEDLNLPFIPLETDPKYIVVQAHAGRDNPCPMRREIPIKIIEHIIDTMYPIPVILVGTNKKYKKIECADNLIGKTDIIEVSSIVANGYGFIGPEGYLSFLALSQKIPSIIFFIRKQPIQARLLNNPWTSYIIDLIKL